MHTWDENKRRYNLLKHGIDFRELEQFFDFPVQTEENIDHDSGERRLRSIGWLRGEVVVLVWLPDGDDNRIISCRRGNRRETRNYLNEVYF